MQVDDSPLGNLAEPRKRVAVAQVGRRQGPHRLGTGLLEDVVRLDLAAQSRAQLPLDEGHELRPVRLEKFGQGVGVVTFQAGNDVVGHGQVPGTLRVP